MFKLIGKESVHFSHKQRFNSLFLTWFCFNLIDFGTTLFALSWLGVKEANPIANYFFMHGFIGIIFFELLAVSYMFITIYFVSKTNSKCYDFVYNSILIIFVLVFVSNFIIIIT